MLDSKLFDLITTYRTINIHNHHVCCDITLCRLFIAVEPPSDLKFKILNENTVEMTWVRPSSTIQGFRIQVVSDAGQYGVNVHCINIHIYSYSVILFCFDVSSLFMSCLFFCIGLEVALRRPHVVPGSRNSLSLSLCLLFLIFLWDMLYLFFVFFIFRIKRR